MEKVEVRSNLIAGKPLPLDTMIIDIEALKVKASDGVHPYRFQTYMIGTIVEAGNRNAIVQLASDNEAALLAEFERWLAASETKRILYWAGWRNFDRDVLNGTWRSARLPLAPAPRSRYPFLELGERQWVNMARKELWGVSLGLVDRSGDTNGKDCMAEWRSGNRERCWAHNLLDCIEMARAADRLGLEAMG